MFYRVTALIHPPSNLSGFNSSVEVMFIGCCAWCFCLAIFESRRYLDGLNFHISDSVFKTVLKLYGERVRQIFSLSLAGKETVFGF